MDPRAAVEFLEAWGYPAFAALLLATGLGVPIPEDLVLLAGGFLISADVFSWPATLPIAYVGVLCSDFMLYAAGSRMAHHLSTRGWVRRLVSGGKPAVARAWLDRYGEAAVFFARLVPGTRYLVFISAGVHGVPARRFVLFDALGAAIWVPLLLKLGAEVGEEIGGIESLMRGMGRIAMWLLVAGVIGVTTWWRFFRR